MELGGVQGQGRDVVQRGRERSQSFSESCGRMRRVEENVQGYGHVFQERPHAQAAQHANMPHRAAGAGKVAGQGAHIHALAGLDLEFGMIGIGPADELEPVHLGRAWRQLGRAAVAGQVVGALALYLDGREGGGDLHDVAAELRQGGADFVIGGAGTGCGGYGALGVIGIARLAETDGEMIDFGAVHNVRHGFGGRPQGDGQNAGGQRVQSAAMAGFLRVERAFHLVHRLGAGDALRFVQNNPAVQFAAFFLPSHENPKESNERR